MAIFWHDGGFRAIMTKIDLFMTKKFNRFERKHNRKKRHGTLMYFLLKMKVSLLFSLLMMLKIAMSPVDGVLKIIVVTAGLTVYTVLGIIHCALMKGRNRGK
jgi:hypothetical protein